LSRIAIGCPAFFVSALRELLYGRSIFLSEGMNKSMEYAYIRVSTSDQHEDRQVIAMDELRIPPENIFTDKLSGKDTKRPQLNELMKTVQSGDKVIVESISRFARNTRDLLDLVEQLTAKGVEFVSQKEKIDTSTPTGKFMLAVFGAVAELERGYLLQRTLEGVSAARKRGVRFGRPTKQPPNDFTNIVRKWRKKEISIHEALKICDMGKTTFYQRLREFDLL